MSERARSAPFIELLESLGMPAQFSQGRRYARAGHVRDLSVSASIATALVVDSDGQTYRAKVATRAFTAAEWNLVERALVREAIHLARLLSGQLPDDVEGMLAGLGLSLLPTELSELALDCTCPSWRIPCGHLTAACYALAEEFERDPFSLLAWRGRGRDELLDRLRRLRSRPDDVASPHRPAPALATFWTAGPRRAPADRAVPGTVRRPDALFDQLDPLPLTTGRHQVVELLLAAYEAMTATESTVD
jgi:uncharacterized Zn finger protein